MKRNKKLNLQGCLIKKKQIFETNISNNKKSEIISSFSTYTIPQRNISIKPITSFSMNINQTTKQPTIEKKKTEINLNENFKEKYLQIKKLLSQNKFERIERSKDEDSVILLNSKTPFYCSACLKEMVNPQYCATHCFKNVCKKCSLDDSVCPLCLQGKLYPNPFLNQSILNFSSQNPKNEEILLNFQRNYQDIPCKGNPLGCSFSSTSSSDLDQHQLDCIFALRFEKNQLKGNLLFLLSQIEEIENQFDI